MSQTVAADPTAAAEPAARGGVLDLLLDRATRWGGRVALSDHAAGGWTSLSFAALNERSRALSDALLEGGFPRGERIAILSESRPEWAIAFFAAVRAGAVLVPLDPKLSPEELAAILSDAHPRLLFVSSRLAPTGLGLLGAIDGLREVLALDGPPAPPALRIGDLRAGRPQEGRERDMEETALLVYTSGTTGRPRGVRISFRSLVFEVESLCRQVPIAPGEVFLSMLPLNHLLELTGGLLCVLWSGGEVCYAHTLLPHEMARVMAEKRVTQMVTVPLFLRLLSAEIRKAAARAGFASRLAFELADAVARLLPAPNGRRRLFRAAHARLGGRLRRFVVGGSALDPATEGFFERLGIEVCQGYGLTECSPVVAVNAAGARRRRSVGRPLPGVEVRIFAEGGGPGGEGEILTRGPHLMQGYVGDAQSPVDGEGWLHTGDLGRLDADGYLYVTGRLKDLIVLASGKKVQPEEVEAALDRGVALREACVVGSRAREGLLEGTEEVCAVVVPADGLGGSVEAAREEVDRLAEPLAPHKRPSRVVLHPGPLPRSVTHKVQRRRVLAWLEGQEGEGR